MEWSPILEILRESIAFILLVLALLAYTMTRGLHSLVALILGLYIALLISLKFPYYDALYGLTDGEKSNAILAILFFALITVLATILFGRLLSGGYDESALDAFWKKFLFALFGAALIMTYSYHVLPITTFVEPGPVGLLFAPEANFFWWLIIPLMLLFLL